MLWQFEFEFEDGFKTGRDAPFEEVAKKSHLSQKCANSYSSVDESTSIAIAPVMPDASKRRT
jgi:hypothetical protein